MNICRQFWRKRVMCLMKQIVKQSKKIGNVVFRKAVCVVLIGMKLHRVKTQPTRSLVKTRKTFKWQTNDMISPPIGKNFEKTPWKVSWVTRPVVKEGELEEMEVLDKEAKSNFRLGCQTNFRLPTPQTRCWWGFWPVQCDDEDEIKFMLTWG